MGYLQVCISILYNSSTLCVVLGVLERRGCASSRGKVGLLSVLVLQLYPKVILGIHSGHLQESVQLNAEITMV